VVLGRPPYCPLPSPSPHAIVPGWPHFLPRFSPASIPPVLGVPTGACSLAWAVPSRVFFPLRPVGSTHVHIGRPSPVHVLGRLPGRKSPPPFDCRLHPLPHGVRASTPRFGAGLDSHDTACACAPERWRSWFALRSALYAPLSFDRTWLCFSGSSCPRPVGLAVSHGAPRLRGCPRAHSAHYMVAVPWPAFALSDTALLPRPRLMWTLHIALSLPQRSPVPRGPEAIWLRSTPLARRWPGFFCPSAAAHGLRNFRFFPRWHRFGGLHQLMSVWALLRVRAVPPLLGRADWLRFPCTFPRRACLGPGALPLYRRVWGQGTVLPVHSRSQSVLPLASAASATTWSGYPTLPVPVLPCRLLAGLAPTLPSSAGSPPGSAFLQLAHVQLRARGLSPLATWLSDRACRRATSGVAPRVRLGWSCL